MYQKFYFEATLDHIEQVSHLPPHLRIGWANNRGYIPYPGGGEKWGGNGVGDDLYSYGFDGANLWTGGRATPVNPMVRNLVSHLFPNCISLLPSYLHVSACSPSPSASSIIASIVVMLHQYLKRSTA